MIKAFMDLKLRQKLIVFPVAVLIPVLLLGVALLNIMASRTNQAIYNGNLNMVTSFVISMLDDRKSEATKNIKLLGHNESVIAPTRQAVLNNDRFALITEVLNLADTVDTNVISILDSSGKVLVRSNNPEEWGDVNSAPEVAQAAGGSIVSTIEQTALGYSVVSYGPIQDSSRIIGIMRLEAFIDGNFLLRIKELTGADLIILKSGEINTSTLEDFEGIVLDHAVMEQASSQRKALSSIVKIKKANFFAMYTALDNSARGAQLHDTVVILTSAAEFFKSRRNVWLISLSLLVLMLAGIIVMAFSLGHLVSSPLIKVRDHIQNMADGNLLQKELDISSRDEMGQMAKALNNMIRSLSKIVTKANLIADGNIGSDEVERKLAAGMTLNAAAASAVTDEKGDLAEAFNKMESELRKLTVQARRIADDDLTNPVLSVKNRGELGEAFARMTATLVGFSDIAKNIARGDLGDNVKAASERQVLTSAFEQMISHLKLLISSVKTQAGVLAQSSSVLSRISSQTSENVSQFASTVNNISNATTSVAKSVQAVSTSSRNADTASKKGQELMARLVENISQIKLTSERSGKAMDSLAGRSAKISEMVELITKISDQTNLLALNAAIEAARAGEAGRGFAVVADEVRKLAENSSSSALEISKIVSEVETETRDASAAVGSGRQVIDNGVSISNEAALRFNEIAQQVDGISQQIASISAAAEESAAGAEESSAASEEQAATVQEISASAQQLTVAVSELEEAVSKFRI